MCIFDFHIDFFLEFLKMFTNYTFDYHFLPSFTIYFRDTSYPYVRASLSSILLYIFWFSSLAFLFIYLNFKLLFPLFQSQYIPIIF